MNQKLFPIINILHAALTFTPLLFFGIIIYLLNGLPSVQTDFSNPLVYIVIIAFISAFTFHYLLYPNRINKINDQADLQTKINSWRTLFLIRCAITEGASLVCAVCMIISEYAFFFYLFIPLIVLQLSYFPTRNKVQIQLNLSEEELRLI